MKTILIFSLVVFPLLVGCNPGGGDKDNNFNSGNVNNTSIVDRDGDGYAPATGDCDDTDSDIHPGATEVPDGVDNNCDGFIDNDYDGDGYPSPADCNDNDPNIHPNALEDCFDGIDNNCNGLIDNEETDDDGDGYSECEGDCDDHNDKKGIGAIEDPTDGIDNDCDGFVDEIDEPCDCARNEATLALTNMGTSMENLSKALGICNTAVFSQPIQMLYAQSWGIISYDELGHTANANGWGDIRPIPPRVIDENDPVYPASCQAVVLFTGEAFNPYPEDLDMDLGQECPFDPVTLIDNAEPDDVPSECHDLTQIKMVLRVPGNVTGIAFDFIYLSSEYPEWVGSEFNDTFYAIIGKTTPDATHINISFDGNGKAVTINNNYFEEPGSLSQSINGTGYEGSTGSATGWLTTKAPVEPNSIIEVIFSIHDEGDGILDSAVVIDNFRWTTVPIDGPITVE
ncbi:putative metal-binding motif-containing protein [Myxococcota bacterium]|nr:putative metal-binding motif-containing protein [Myxococcota bacterium]MBU1536537.1 putative metal-binding motif-containing protein [Myxococcota bacterium]